MRRILVVLIFICSFSPTYAQQTDVVDFEKAKGELEFFPEEKKVKGKLTYTFKILQKTDSVYLDAHRAKVNLFKKGSSNLKLKTTSDKIYFVGNFKKDNSYTASFYYEIENPEKALYFLGWDNKGSNQIWSQGQGQENSHWLPSLSDANDKIVFDLTYKVPEGYTAIGNGKMTQHQTKNGQEIWRYKMKKTMSSYLVAVAVGDYKKKTIKSSSGVPIELYYEEKDADKVEWTYKYSKEIFDFLEQEIGVDYPWENYKMIPVRDFLYSGMENTTATIFSENFMTDSIGFVDRNFVNVNAHELAHQWFGNYVTEHSSEHHWLQEGFASYYALLAEKEIFDEDHYYYALFKSADELKTQSDDGKGEALDNPKASSLTFYEKGAWALHILKERIGSTAFKTGIKNYLKKYAYQSVKIDDFITEMEKSSGKSLSNFKRDWIIQSAFQADETIESLKESSFISEYISLAALRETDLRNKFSQLNKGLDFPVNEFIGQEVVNQLAQEPPSTERTDLFKKAFASNEILVRQAIANSLTEIPAELQSQYETLLDDDSYLTQEKAFFYLWNNFPDKKEEYLDKLKNNEGFHDKNIRTVWLTLALVTQTYKPNKKSEYFNELADYASVHYDYSIRENALGYLYQINALSDENYKDLMQATVHPVWRFRKFARQLLGRFLEDDNHKDRFKILKPGLPENQQNVLNKALKKK